jgi:P4 family phage/plasmid primase-like protien
MQNTAVHEALNNAKCRILDKNSPINVLSQGSVHCKAGKWFIPTDKYESLFLKNINAELVKNPLKQMHFLELPNTKHNMLKIDLDLKFKATEEEIKTRTNLTRRYNDEYIELFATTIAEKLKDIIKINESYNIYIHEKKEPRFTNDNTNTIKDGIHIIIPKLVMSNTSLFHLREKLVEDEDIQEITKTIENITPLDDVIDKRIIFPNAWYVYGCGKPEDLGNYYKVTKIYRVSNKNNNISIKTIQSDKTVTEYIKLFSNFGKIHNVEYLIDFEDEEQNDDKYSKEKSFGQRDQNSMIRNFTQNQTNFRRISTLTASEIKALLNCLKKERADSYEDWKRIGICLYNMDDRNFDTWRIWSSQSSKYNIDVCTKFWFSDFPKCGKYNLDLNKLKEMAKKDNFEEYQKITNINKNHFFDKWIYEHAKETHIKVLSVGTLSNNIKTYIKDYANFNVACACPGSNPIWYKFDNHKWQEDKAANKIYMLMTVELQKEISIIHESLKMKVFGNQNNCTTNSNGSNGSTNSNTNGANSNQLLDDEESVVSSYQKHLFDDREAQANLEEQKRQYFENQHAKASLDKCGQILAFLSTPINKKKIIEDLSQKCYDDEFHTNLDENRNIFVCNNGVLDLQHCIFRNGEPSDMMTMSSKIDFPTDVDTLEAQEIMYSIQDWLDRILPVDAVQEYVLNIFALKLSGDLFGEYFIIFTGSGANGKSQLFKLIGKTFGEYFKSFDNTLLNTPKRDAQSASPATASLKGARIAMTTEPKGGQPFESDKVKELISGDELVGRHLNKDLIRFIPQYLMMMQCNDIPRNESTDDGFWRKICVVKCPSKFVIKEEDMYKLDDPDKFPYHFKAENQEHLYTEWAPYFLYMLFERYKVLKSNKCKFNIPDEVNAAVKEYQEEASTYTQFFNDKVEEAPGCKIDSTELYSEFQTFVGRDFKTQKNVFIKQMERYIGKPKGHPKSFVGFKLHGTSGNPIDTQVSDVLDMD